MISGHNGGKSPIIVGFAFLAASTSSVFAEDAPNVSASPALIADASPLADTSTETRIVVVEWKIKKGREKEFLDYWATKSTVPDRSGLIAEFMTSEEDRGRFPWINWVNAESPDYTTFYNVGIWHSSNDFINQIGSHIDNARPPMPFEADHRHRVFLQPVKWRIGATGLPDKDATGVR